MKINAFADVSLRALMVLAAAPDGGLLTTQNVADAVGTPYNHVSKAVAKLRMTRAYRGCPWPRRGLADFRCGPARERRTGTART